MEYVVIMILVILVAAMAGFVLLALTPMKHREAESSGQKIFRAYDSTRGITFDTCYDNCMAGESWIPVKGNECVALCNTSRLRPFNPEPRPEGRS